MGDESVVHQVDQLVGWCHYCHVCRSICLDLDTARLVLVPKGAPWNMHDLCHLFCKSACEAGLDPVCCHVLTNEQWRRVGGPVCPETLKPLGLLTHERGVINVQSS